ncbi:hypothetical protein F4781DRAFT_35877 [Annulohypoxylon bovei var. microspora]|nr:hypothetical protein F4781DRAFT_35877 [Annulohypoxylon bovei var. microspora]
MAESDVILVPLQLQAFILNPEVCNKGTDDDKGARIIPITQPNYTFLRLDNFLIQSDVLNHADLHNSAPAETNPRMYDMGAQPEPQPRLNRYGVYLHWILPQAYRSGIVAADSVPPERHEKERLQRGLPPRTDRGINPDTKKTDTPEFLQPPTRWIVIRKLELDSIEPEEAKPYFKEYEAWVLESDYQWNLDDIPLDYDLQVDVSPFVVGQAGEGIDIDEQAEVFIGRKTRLEDYSPDPDAKIANISLLRSSNPFFADFQLHNSNVFSSLDNFEYSDSTDSRKYLEKANASYYLVGWHSDASTDPLFDESGEFKHSEKLKGIYMTLKESGIDEITNNFLDSKYPIRMCLHGAMYDVKWDLKSKPKSVPADDYSEALQQQEVPAISLGTTPMDALITYCTARKGYEEDEVIEKLEEDILAIDSLLHARDDGVEGQREAKDMIYNWNFSRSQAGTHYFIAGEDSQGECKKPSDETISALKELNQWQQTLDACNRSATQYRWDMFSLWWKYVTDVTNKQGDDVDNETFKNLVDDISKRLNKLQARIKELNDGIQAQIDQEKDVSLKDLKTNTLPFYSRARDPTVLVGGIDPGWPADYSDNVAVRIAMQFVTSPGDIPQGLGALATLSLQKFPQTTPLKEALGLLTEFWTLFPANPTPELQVGQAYPQFHDQISSTMSNKLWRDRWEDRQPWFPLYVEWEVEYTHVPFEFWSLDEQAARLSASPLVRYGIPATDGTPLWDKMKSGNPEKSLDTRNLSGRVLILPQPSFSLAAKVKQLFSDTPPAILEKYLDADKRQDLLDNINKLSYLSCPLAGLTEGLLTLSTGTHIKPENKYVTEDGQQSTTAVKSAQFPGVSLDKDNIQLIANNSGFTPYASQNDYTSAPFCPFKPATHGQFRFIKFNIIDKFGQSIPAINPKPRPGPRTYPPLYPCISDFYEPQLVTVDSTKVANTVYPNEGTKCEFIQLPPQINQNSRLNADFVIREKGGGAGGLSYWRPVTEWENPIWGWLVINYADYGIQVFLPDGTFYREVRIGGPNGALAEPKWLPFAEDPNLPLDENNVQLDALVDKLRDKDYLLGFWVMIGTAIQNMPATPGSYAQFLGSIVGKPLALANMGWSLELDGPPLQNQSTKAKVVDPEIHLLPSQDYLHSYEFQVKLGDEHREYDGLVGYFDSISDPKPTEDEGHELILDYVNTYFVAENVGDPPVTDSLHPINTTNYPKFQPYWVAPFPNDGDGDSEYGPPYITPEQYTETRNSQMRVFGAILDPFTPTHGLSSFLPAKSLQLPSWTWQGAMQNITAFFHSGPLNVTQDVGTYDDTHPLTTASMKDAPPRNLSLPSLGAGDWNWLQPFVDPDPIQDLPVFNAFGIEKKGNLITPGFQKGPYTAVEGFLQLRRPIMVDNPKKDN